MASYRFGKVGAMQSFATRMVVEPLSLCMRIVTWEKASFVKYSEMWR
jgi:hypothetical protein